MTAAGALAGALMGLIFVGHLSLMMALRPPESLRRRAEDSTVMPIVLGGTLAALTAWVAAGVGAGLAFQVAEREFPAGVPGMPSVAYTAGVVIAAALMAPPLMLLARRALRHLAAEYALFIGIFGWLIPLAVSRG